jgi:hypothetical protein
MTNSRPHHPSLRRCAYALDLHRACSTRTGVQLCVGIGRELGNTVAARSCTEVTRGAVRLDGRVRGGLERGQYSAQLPICIVDNSRRELRTIQGQPLPGLTGESRPSFAEISRTKTAASANTHQRTRQAACRPGWNALAITASADTVQTHRAMVRTNAAKQAISSDRPHDRISRGRVLARVFNQVFHSVEAVEPACQASAKRKNPAKPLHGDPRLKRPGWGGGGGRLARHRYNRPIPSLSRSGFQKPSVSFRVAVYRP